MTATYLNEVKSEKKYIGNVVLKVAEVYFAIREPDSGLSIQTPFNKSFMALTLNPTSIDPRKVTTTISSFSFKLLDKDGIVTSLVLGDAAQLIGQAVEIYLGRSNVGMDFADYFKLPTTYITKCDHSENAYNFNSSEQTERMAKPIYDTISALAVDILAATATWTMRDSITNFPTSGFLKCNDEFVSYTGLDLVNNRITGVVRGELNSIPAAHDANTDVLLAEAITDNPLNIILKLLISGGGGGTYDVLKSGLGISNTLIDIAEIEALRDDLFIGVQYTLVLYSVDSALKFIESELLMSNGLRFTNSINSKVTLAILDKARFVEEVDVINEDTIVKYPKWAIDGTKVTNQLEIQWDYKDGTNVFLARSTYSDADSIATYGAQKALKFVFKGVKASLDGQALVDDFAQRLLARLSTPTPTISINTQIDKSLQTVGDKAYLVSSKIPAIDGTLNFASDLEIISRSINQTSGDVQFTLAFTSFTNIRSAFIAPSDLITSKITQRKINVAEGRGSKYLVGWYMRLWDEVNQVYTSDPANKIIAIDIASKYLVNEDGDRLVAEDGSPFITEQDEPEDSITFQDAWATSISTPNNYRIRFVDYDGAIDSQKRYAFISDGGNDFADGKPSYKVTY
jgi:hypothetical protein